LYAELISKISLSFQTVALLLVVWLLRNHHTNKYIKFLWAAYYKYLRLYHSLTGVFRVPSDLWYVWGRLLFKRKQGHTKKLFISSLGVWPRFFSKKDRAWLTRGW